MKYILLAFVGLCVLACSSGKKAYFDFDQIDYYHIDIDADELIKQTPNSKSIPNLKWDVVTGYTPENISDLSFIDKLEGMGYKKTAVDKSEYSKINAIFTEKEARPRDIPGCAHLYRDILIFKKNNKVVGTAKICFSCWGYDIKGASVNTDGFREEDSFQKLDDILRK